MTRIGTPRANSSTIMNFVKRTRRKLKGGTYNVYDRNEDGSFTFIHEEDKDGVILTTIRRKTTQHSPSGSARISLQETYRNPENYEVTTDEEKIAAGWRYIRKDARTLVLTAPHKLNNK